MEAVKEKGLDSLRGVFLQIQIQTIIIYFFFDVNPAPALTKLPNV
jgi:hypothetical protein